MSNEVLILFDNRRDYDLTFSALSPVWTRMWGATEGKAKSGGFSYNLYMYNQLKWDGDPPLHIISIGTSGKLHLFAKRLADLWDIPHDRSWKPKLGRKPREETKK